MKVIVCGGRHFNDQTAVWQALDAAHAHKPITMVIQGACSGADHQADEWAKAKGVARSSFPYPEGKGKAGGPIRNEKMIELKPDGVIAFPGGRGTADMTRRADLAGVPVWRPYK